VVNRTIDILDTVNFWINDFRANMMKNERQSIGYSTLLNMIARLGTIVLSQPDKLTDEQRQMIISYIDESNHYDPPYARIKWADKYYQFMIPKILSEEELPGNEKFRRDYEKQTYKYLIKDVRI